MTLTHVRQEHQAELLAPPVFLIGPRHSGAALLACALDQHDNLATTPGLEWIYALGGALQEAYDRGVLLKQGKGPITDVGQLQAARVDEDDYWAAFGEPAARLASRRVSGSRKPRWVDSSPQSWAHLYTLARLFPRGQFIHVTREPGEVAAVMTSDTRTNYSKSGPGKAFEAWKAATVRCLELEAALGRDRVHRVDFDDIRADPEQVLRVCLDFLGETWEPRCLWPLRGGAGDADLSPADLTASSQGRSALETYQHAIACPPPAQGDLAVLERMRDRLANRRAGTSVEPFRPDRSAKLPERRDPVGQFLATVLPEGASYVVISRGDPDLVDIPGRTGRHFPASADGSWTGYHPADSDEALDQLRAAMQAGASFLVIPRDSFWWLDFYAGFRGHLLNRHEVVAFDADKAVVVKLAGSAPVGRALFDFHYTPRDAEAALEPGGHSSVSRTSDVALNGSVLDTAAHQFVVLGPDESGPLPEGWRAFDEADWRLGTHPTLPVHRLVDRARGRRVGWLLGWPIDGARLVDGQFDLDDSDDRQRTDDQLGRLRGRFVAVVVNGRSPRVVLDGGGTLATVFHRDRQVIGSTVTAVAAVIGDPLDPPRADEFPADRSNQFWPFGLTCRDDISRLLPNHALDLGAWAPTRTWPNTPIERCDETDTVAAVAKIASSVGGTIEAFAAQSDLLIGLTAGMDSRVLLACARGVSDTVRCFTFDYGSAPGDAIDLIAGRALAKRAGVRHTTLDVPVTLAQHQVEEYQQLTGHHGHPGKARDFRAAVSGLRRGQTLLPGFFGGGVSRGFYWSQMPKERDRLTPERLLERLRLPTDHTRLRAAAAQWLGAVPEGDARFVLDLLYHEQRGGCWASPHMYGFAPFQAIAAPFANRDATEAAFRLPVRYRKEHRMATDIVTIMWPELIDMPFNALAAAPR